MSENSADNSRKWLDGQSSSAHPSNSNNDLKVVLPVVAAIAIGWMSYLAY